MDSLLRSQTPAALEALLLVGMHTFSLICLYYLYQNPAALSALQLI